MDKGTKKLQKILDEIREMTPEEFSEMYESWKAEKKNSMHKVVKEEIALDSLGQLFCSNCYGDIESTLIEEAQKNQLTFISCSNCLVFLSLIDILGE